MVQVAVAVAGGVLYLFVLWSVAAPKYIYIYMHLFCFRSPAAFLCSALSTGTELRRVGGCTPPTSNWGCRGMLGVLP